MSIFKTPRWLQLIFSLFIFSPLTPVLREDAGDGGDGGSGSDGDGGSGSGDAGGSGDGSGGDSLDDASPEDMKKMIHDLRRESAGHRTKKKEFEDRLNKIESDSQKEKERKLEEDGKLKDLLEEKNKTIEGLNGLKTENDGYLEYFKNQIAEKSKGLTDVERELVENSSIPAPEKLQMIDKLLSQKGKGSSSPGGKPGAQNVPDKTLDEYLKPEKRLELTELRTTNPDLYRRVIDRKKQLENN